jgi:hypothetical protein
MEIHQHNQLISQLQQYFQGKGMHISYTQWDVDQEDEEVTEFDATLETVTLTDNEFEEKDLLLVFLAGDEEIEILMEIPKEESNLADFEDNTLRIFGLEAEIQISL